MGTGGSLFDLLYNSFRLRKVKGDVGTQALKSYPFGNRLRWGSHEHASHACETLADLAGYRLRHEVGALELKAL